jgi:hypothetical protein
MAYAIPSGALVDGSGTITLGGTAQTVFAANISRQYLLIQNVSAEDMWVNFGIAAVANQPSIKLVAGASVEFSVGGTGVVPTASVSVIAATTGSAFTAKQA